MAHSEGNALRFPGLTVVEAKRRLLIYGENEIYRKKRLRPVVAFIKKFNSPLLLMLIGTATVSFFLGQKTNAIIILLMVVMSAVMDFVNTRKSEAVAENLVAQVASMVTVIRGGKRMNRPIKELVPGDIIELSAGNVIPADCRVLLADDFFANQSSLTGESFPVEKCAHPTGDTSIPPANETLDTSSENNIFMGTSVVTGFGTALVLRTGAAAEFGRIAGSLASAEQETDFERGIRNFSTFILKLTLVMVIIVLVVNIWMDRNLLESFLFSVAIAVGLTPELLPVIMAVSLAHGSMVMSKKNVIVKNLSAIQNFGGMDLLCTDKTGTLTEDKIALVRCVDRDGNDSADVLRSTYVSSMMHTARKGPLDTAIKEHGAMDISEYKKVDEVPFDFHRRRDSVVVDKGEERIIIAKGAPENVLDVCTHCYDGNSVVDFSEQLRKKAMEEYDRLSADGFRVLAISEKHVPREDRIVYSKDEEAAMTLLGFAAFLDPPKTSVRATLEELKDLSIDVKIVTGDSEMLTKRICADIGIEVIGMLSGDEVSKMSDSELAIKVEKTTVFARVSPEQKERIISVLRKNGHVVGYMGDGINDAPVLKAADVGISVNNAVDVAKETADIILLTKSLEVLKDGIIEGRKTFQNTLKYIKMGFSSNFGNMFSMMGASAVLPFLPMLPSQILLNNFFYDMSQTTLSTDSIDDEDTKKPLRWDMHYFGKYVAAFGLVSSIFDFITFFVLYKVFELTASEFQAGWFIESIATQVLIIYVIRTKRVPFFKSFPSKPVIFSTVGIVLLAWILPFTPIGNLLSFARLSIPILFAIAGIVAAYLVVGEVAKMFFYRVYPKAP